MEGKIGDFCPTVGHLTGRLKTFAYIYRHIDSEINENQQTRKKKYGNDTQTTKMAHHTNAQYYLKPAIKHHVVVARCTA